jgi:FHA domain-containing protein
MIGGDRPGFSRASAAMREALKDIKAHEMALVAAIQVALTRLLEQIAPETLKQRLENRWLDGLVPGARKARIWEIYESTHAELARELADDFDRAFGKAFAEAYEEYLRAK